MTERDIRDAVPANGAYLESSRARVIEMIYELALAPNRYNDFMEDWERHISALVLRLEDLGETTGRVDDPVLETHFNRAFAILERLGRGSPQTAGDSDQITNSGLTVRRNGSVEAGSGASGGLAEITKFADLEPLFFLDSWSRLSEAFTEMRRARLAGRALVLAVNENAQMETGAAFMLTKTSRDPGNGDIVLRLTPLSVNWNGHLEELIQTSFRLTRSETRLVQALAKGMSLNTVSAEAGRSMNTLRSQLKSVFQKTRTNSQSDLVRLISTLSGVSGDTTSLPENAPVAVHSGRLELMRMSNDRLMPVYFLGPEDGIPVVFIHGMLDGIAVTTKIHRLLHKVGIRLIAPVRPNFGEASPDSQVREAPAVFARDVASLIDELNIEKCLVLGHMAGSVYAFAAAAEATRAIAGIVSVSGGVPIKSVRQFSLMKRRQRTVAYTARFAPNLLPMVLRAGIAQIDSDNPEAFMEALYEAGTIDRDVVRNLEVCSAVLDGYRFAVAQGHTAFATDSYHVTRDWSHLAKGSVCPVKLLHGIHDPVVNFETVRHFANALAGRAELETFTDSGQLLFYQQPERVLESLVAFWEDTIQYDQDNSSTQDTCPSVQLQAATFASRP